MADDFLPPGFDAARLAQAQRAFESALGADKVFFEPLDRTGYKDKFSIDDGAHLPSGAIAPTSVEEVQAALRVANQYRLPLWPISRGKNLGYGGSAPLLSGSVVMDLSRMKRIEFDEEFGTVLLEPGVGFYDLYDFIQANNLPYWLSTPGNSWGSVIGNALDRASQFLGIASIAAVVLAGGAGALSSSRFATRHFDTSALLRSMGASRRRVMLLFAIQLAFIGLVATSIGLLLGWLMQWGLVFVLRDLLPPNLPGVGLKPLAVGAATGFIGLAGFALPTVRASSTRTRVPCGSTARKPRPPTCANAR